MSFRQAFNQDAFQAGDLLQNINTNEIVRIEARWYTFNTKLFWYSLSNGRDISEAELREHWTVA